MATGGVARKSPYAMRVVADAMKRPVIVAASEQTVALGAAMLAAVAAGLHPDVGAAQAAMGAGVETAYEPDPSRAAHYDERYRRYLELGGFAEAYSRTGAGR
jgi:L-ribulokinase